MTDTSPAPTEAHPRSGPAAFGPLGSPIAGVLMVCSAASFASMSACARGLHGQCDWRIVALVRATLALVFTLGIVRAVRSPIVWPGPRTLWVRSLTGSAGMVCTFFSLAHLPVSRSVTLLNSFPVWVALLSWPVLGLRPSPAVGLAVVCGMAGVHVLSGDSTGSVAGWGTIAAALSASVSTAIVMLGLHRLRRLHPLSIALYFAFISSIVVSCYVALSVWFGEPLAEFHGQQTSPWLLLTGVGGFATLGQIFMTSAFQRGRPDRLAPIALSQSAFALGYDCLIWHQPLDARLLLGMALVLAPGVWLVSRPQSERGLQSLDCRMQK